MARQANQPFTSESVKHFGFDSVEIRTLEISMRTLAGLPVDDADKSFVAGRLGTVSALWLKFKQARTAFESLELFAAMSAATGVTVTPEVPADDADKSAEPAVNGKTA